jgi:hypothetical protein
LHLGVSYNSHGKQQYFLKQLWELSHITEQHSTASTDIHGYDKSTAWDIHGYDKSTA